MYSGDKFTMYWSGFEKYEACAQQYLWHYGWGAIDVGGGPGRPKPKPLKKSNHDAIMGIVISHVIEHLYNDELWKTPDRLVTRLHDMAHEKFEREILKPRHFIDWRLSPTKDEMLQVCKDGISGFLKTMKVHKLLGPYARSEVDLVAYVNKYTPIGGRPDFIIRRDDTGITILDGKNGRKKATDEDTYLKPDQLRWYALCFYLAYQTMPNRLGFLYWRFPVGMEREVVQKKGQAPVKVVEEGIDWIPFTREDLKGLAERAITARKSLDKELFPADPVPSKCKLCDYETVCPERLAQKEKNRRKPKNLEEQLDGAVGLVEFGMDD